MSRTGEVITYVLRCHSVSTLPKLMNALASVASQTYPNTKALVAVQDLPSEDLEKIITGIETLRSENGMSVEVRNFSFPSPGDHRGALLNKALDSVNSRYVGFLDYDDIVYPNHAETLISDLQKKADTSAVASFGGCTLAFYDDVADGEIDITRKETFFPTPSVSSCIISNCFPIHSYVIDLQRLVDVPRFGEDSHMHEDYIFLLALLEKYPVSTRCARVPLCEYRMNNSNTNTVSLPNARGVEAEEKMKVWEKDLERIDRMKSGRFFQIPYEEIVDCGLLSRQPFFRGVFVCHVAKKIYKKHGSQETARFLSNPKRYSRSLPPEERSMLMRVFF